MSTPWTRQPWNERSRWSRTLFMLVNGFVTIGLLSLVGFLARLPFIFPSLGPTAYLHFSAPLAPASSPRNTLLGHAIGILCGYGALLLTGLADAPSILTDPVGLPRVLAAALSLGLTGALMVLCKVDHPPAGATTLIVSLGFIAAPVDLLVIEAAVAALTLLALLLNRAAGLPYPLWAAKPL